MDRVSDSLHSRFPGDGRAATVPQSLATSCIEFVQSGLADPKFVSELTGKSETAFWSSISEALVYKRLNGKSFPARSAVGIGPDFLLELDGQRVWLEVICPEPSRVPSSWLEIQTDTATSMPHEEILLRWTGAIKEKTEKLVGSRDGNRKGYLQTGPVGAQDVYVIVVNGCRLRHGPFPALTGISQLPYAVEAVFPIGPYQVRIDKHTHEMIETGHSYRPEIRNANGSPVPSSAFLDPWFSMVSAVWAVDFNGCSCIGNSEPSAVVHNPNALNPLPLGFLPADEEFLAKFVSEELIELERVKPRFNC